MAAGEDDLDVRLLGRADGEPAEALAGAPELPAHRHVDPHLEAQLLRVELLGPLLVERVGAGVRHLLVGEAPVDEVPGAPQVEHARDGGGAGHGYILAPP
nr:hypothetical protein [Pseudonocardia asaccharolytica]